MLKPTGFSHKWDASKSHKWNRQTEHGVADARAASTKLPNEAWLHVATVEQAGRQLKLRNPVPLN